jgi:hypothetical protein
MFQFLVDKGWVGIVGAINKDGATYIQALKDAEAFGTIVGRDIAMVNKDNVADSLASWSL